MRALFVCVLVLFSSTRAEEYCNAMDKIPLCLVIVVTPCDAITPSACTDSNDCVFSQTNQYYECGIDVEVQGSGDSYDEVDVKATGFDNVTGRGTIYCEETRMCSAACESYWYGYWPLGWWAQRCHTKSNEQWAGSGQVYPLLTGNGSCPD